MSDKFTDIAPTHLVEIHGQFGETPAGEPTAQVRYRWRCSCGSVGRWATSEPSGSGSGAAGERARSGGKRHAKEWGGKFV